MDYGVPDKRKSKKDLRRKRKQRGYKKGGRFRGTKVKESGGK
jgi:hypothetical protein